jgi:Fic family protein
MDKSFQQLPEVFVSDASLSKRVTEAVAAGVLRKIGPRCYTRNLKEPVETVVRRNWVSLVAGYFPDALIADRTALENRPAADGSVFIVSAGSRPVVLPGLAIYPRPGASALPSDPPFLSVFVMSEARALIENMRPSRKTAKRVSPTLSPEELEARLDLMIRRRGLAYVNQLRDTIRELGKTLQLASYAEELDRMIGGLQQTKPFDFASPLSLARTAGLPYDPERLSLFDALAETLVKELPTLRMASSDDPVALQNLSFFDAYFSNYIEGTEFEVDEALEIIFEQKIPASRPSDAHDILGTYRIVSDPMEMGRTANRFEDFLQLLQRRHATIMSGRPEKNPGAFKASSNKAGATVFVAPDLVAGTLRLGFEQLQTLQNAMHRAVFMKFVVSEVHPFDDGNGRCARIMMNAELIGKKEQRIIIPTVFRGNYLSALKAASQNRHFEPLIQVLDYAQKYVKSVPWQSLDETRRYLEQSNAFLSSETAEMEGRRLKIL